MRVLLTLSLIALLITVLSDRCLTESEAFWTWTRDRAEGPPRTAALWAESEIRSVRWGEDNLVFLGSSVTMFGIDSTLIAERLGLRADQVVSVGMAWAIDLELAMLTNQIIRSRPRLVVLMPTARVFENEVDWDRMRLYDPRIALELFTWREILAQRRFHASGLLASSHVVIRHRDALRFVLWEEFVGDIENRGYRRLDWMRLEDPEWGRRWEGSVHGPGCAQVNMRALRLMTEKLVEAGIDTVIAATPILKARQLLELDRCVALVASEVGAHTVLGSDLPLFRRSDFYDFIHLSPRGRRKLSDALVPHVRRALGQGGS